MVYSLKKSKKKIAFLAPTPPPPSSFSRVLEIWYRRAPVPFFFLCGIFLFAARRDGLLFHFSPFFLFHCHAQRRSAAAKKVVWWCYVGEKWGIGACVPIFTLKICFSRISYEGVTFCGKFGRWISNVLSQLILPDYLPYQHILVAKQSAWKIHLKNIFFWAFLKKTLKQSRSKMEKSELRSHSCFYAAAKATINYLRI